MLYANQIKSVRNTKFIFILNQKRQPKNAINATVVVLLFLFWFGLFFLMGALVVLELIAVYSTDEETIVGV